MTLRGDNHTAAYEWLRAAETGALATKATEGPAGYWRGNGWSAGPFFTDANRSRRAPAPPELVEWYKGIIYACCKLNANGVARPALRLYRTNMGGTHRPKSWERRLTRQDRTKWLRGKGQCAKLFNSHTKAAESIDEVTEHPLLTAVSEVNPAWDHLQLIRYTSLSLDLIGRGYWWMEAPKSGVVTDVWPLLPQYVLPVRSGDRALVTQYQYGQMEFQFGELVEYREMAARDPYALGVGSAEAAAAYFEVVDNYVSFNVNMLMQGGKPSLIVSNNNPDEPMGRVERARYQAELNAQLPRAGQGSIWVIDENIKVDPASYPPVDMGLHEVALDALQRVANCFGVPISLLKTEDVNLANAEAGHRQHAELAIDPRCATIGSALTSWTRARGRRLERTYSERGMKIRLGHERLLWAFDNPVAEDEERRAKVVDMQVKNGTRTINETRTEDGEDPVDWGDEPWYPNTLVQPSTAEDQRQITNDHQTALIASRRANPAKDEEDDTATSKPTETPADDETEGRGGRAQGKAMAALTGPTVDLTGVPSARQLLRRALKRTGLDEAYDAGTITDDERVMVLQDLRFLGRRWMRREAERAAQEIDEAQGAKGLLGRAAEAAGRFFGRAKAFVKALVVAGAMAFGGPGELSDAEARAIDQSQAEQVEYLDRFAHEVASGTRSLNPGYAEQYGASVWRSSQNLAIPRGKTLGHTVARRRHLGSDEPCPPCKVDHDRGWVPIDEVTPLGNCEGLNNCHCIIETAFEVP